MQIPETNFQNYFTCNLMNWNSQSNQGRVKIISSSVVGWNSGWTPEHIELQSRIYI